MSSDEKWQIWQPRATTGLGPVRLGENRRTEELLDVQHAVAWTYQAWHDARLADDEELLHRTWMSEEFQQLHRDVWLLAPEARRSGASIASISRATDWTPGIVKRELRIAAGLGTREEV